MTDYLSLAAPDRAIIANLADRCERVALTELCRAADTWSDGTCDGPAIDVGLAYFKRAQALRALAADEGGER